MSNGEINARHYATRKPVRIRWEHGKIIEILPATDKVPDNLWVAPSLYDLQINGYAGVDFQQDNLTQADLVKATRGLRQTGCGLYLLTLVTDEWTRLMARLKHLRALRAQSPELQASIIGWHVEGPFLSPEPGFHGAHDPSVMIDPTEQHIRELRAVTGSDPVLLTIAPERIGALEAIATAVSLGMTVSLGHTNASTDVLRGAVKAGATGFTHLGNAVPQQIDRHDNVLWRFFDTEGLTASLIPDMIHVSPALFRLVHRLLKPESIYYTTDAMSAAGAPPGRYSIGRVQLEVGDDQVVRQPGRTNFAGSALRPIDGVFRAAEMLKKSWQEVWEHSATQPARLMKLTNAMKPGQPANFCLLNVKDGNQIADLCVYLNGDMG